MKNSSVLRGWAVGCCLLSTTLACEEEKTATENKAAPTETAAPAATPTPSATLAPAPAPTPAKAGRPSKIETELTSERRAAVEAKYPEAKGFLSVADIQKTLQKDKTLKDKKSALAAFDKQARGKWLLFAGPLVNLTDAGFDVGVIYTPQLPNDPMGMSKQFFEISVSEVEGYAADDFKSGNVALVIAKYNGNAKAGPGHELVATGAWPQ